MVPVYHVVLHPNGDCMAGYWAECRIDERCCAFTDGDTINETEANMFESVSLMLEGDFPDVTDYSLEFEIGEAVADE